MGENMTKKKKIEGNEDIGLRLLRNLLLRVYNMIYDIPLKWWEYLIMGIFGILTGLGIGLILAVMIKVRLP
jgi:hypothetical protein